MAIIGTNPYAVMTDTSRTYHLIDSNKPPTTDNILSTVQGEMVYTEITMSEHEFMRSGDTTPDEFNDQIKLDLC